MCASFEFRVFIDLTASRVQTLNAITFTSNILFHSDTVPSIYINKKLT